MSRMCLGIDVFVRDLEEHVAFTDFSTEREATIERFEVYDSDTYLLGNDCLYLCLDGRFPPCKHIQPGTGIVCNDPEHSCKDPDCRRCDVVVLRDMPGWKAVNGVAAVLDRYRNLEAAVELAALGDDTLQELLDAAQDLLGYPVCIIDVNQDVVGASTHKELFANPLWETVARDAKTMRCELLDRCSDNLRQESPFAESDAAKAVAMADWQMLACNLFRRGHRIATLWAFQTKAGGTFGMAERRLFSWLAERFGDWAARSKLLRAGRGYRTERFLLDLIDGTPADEAHIREAGRNAGADVVDSPEYQLLVMRPARNAPGASRCLKALEDVEEALPGSISALADYAVIALVGAKADDYLPEAQRRALEALCVENGYCALLGTAFYHLHDAPRVLRQLLDCFPLINAAHEGGGLHHYYDYFVFQSMNLVTRLQPRETLLHPMIRKLAAYDRRCHTDYLETFKVYLNNRCNVTETSKQLHMHRNTLLHRVKRIEDLLESTFEDWTLRRKLLFSIDYLHLGGGGSL